MFIEATLAILIFVVGYILGRLNFLQRNLAILSGNANTNKRWFGRKDKPTKIIDIDESKFVTEISTDSYTSKHKGLGTKTVSKDGIRSSVSKLKNLKERK